MEAQGTVLGITQFIVRGIAFDDGTATIAGSSTFVPAMASTNATAAQLGGRSAFDAGGTMLIPASAIVATSGGIEGTAIAGGIGEIAIKGQSGFEAGGASVGASSAQIGGRTSFEVGTSQGFALLGGSCSISVVYACRFQGHTPQAQRQESVRALTGTMLHYEGDFAALFDQENVPQGDFGGRMVTWVNQRLGTAHGTLPAALDAYAKAHGFDRWEEVDAIPSRG